MAYAEERSNREWDPYAALMSMLAAAFSGEEQRFEDFHPGYSPLSSDVEGGSAADRMCAFVAAIGGKWVRG